MYFAYSLLLAAAMLVALPYFIVVGLRHDKYWRNLPQRLGRLPHEMAERGERSPGAIWIHAVSVGEVAAAAPLARRLKDRFPERRLVVSTTTDTGQRMARERIGWADEFFYFPLDWAAPVRSFFRALRPSVVVILEAEIWPNFLRIARENRVPVVFASARVSERSFRRYRWANGLIERALGDASAFLAQTAEDAQRLVALGAPAGRVSLAGNLKFDVAPPAGNPLADWLAGEIEARSRGPVVVAGSVTAGEEDLVLDAFGRVRERYPAALLVLAPRKPERFDIAAERVAARGWGMARRSGLEPGGRLEGSIPVLLVDTIGELGALYRVADVVFIGGSLEPVGGHNILEPAVVGKAPVFGPYMHNFREIARQFLEAHAARQVATAAALGDAWLDLLADAGGRQAMGQAARELVERNRGATERVLERVEALTGGGGG
jgi:3-deoxy-D-manno-octulosonic-acid transferase